MTSVALLALTRWPVTAATRAAVRAALARPPADLVDALAAHGVLPLAAAVLRSTAWDLVPPPVRAALDDAERESAAYMARWLRDCHRVLDCLEARGLRPVVLKGPPLALRLFGHHRRRPTGDLDVLLPGRDIDAAVEAIEGAGYVVRVPAHIASLRPGQHAVTLDPADGAVAPEIDVHWAFAESWVAGLPGGWGDHVESIELNGRALRVPDPSLGALAAALHLAGHGYELRHAVDLAGWDRLLTSDGRAALRALAVEAGAEGHVLRGLELVRELWGAPHPHADAPLPGASERAHARAALLRAVGVTASAVLRDTPLRRNYLRVVVRALGADRRGAALAGMAGQALWPPPAYLRWRYGSTGLATRLARPFRALLGLGRDLTGQ